MEVRCSNCATEYEFDDALVSARGTSVKCTNCGHQFRVHPTAASPVVAEKWVVRDAQKRETVFTSLRDLQQAIVKGQLSPQHQLSHGGQAFRPLEDIYELQTFFSAARQRPPSRPSPRTLLGVGRDGQPRPPSTPPPRRSTSDPPPARQTPPGGTPASPSATLAEPRDQTATRPSADVQSRPEGRRPTPVPPPRRPSERPTAPPPAAASPADAAPLPWQHLQGLHAEAEEHDLGQRRGAGSRWILAIVVLGGLALVAGTVGRDYLRGLAPPRPAAPVVDERVPALLEQARAALDTGDFEGAHAELAKASVLAEGDPRVAAALARVEVARLELLWIQQRLNAALDAAEEEAATRAPPSRRKKSDAELAAEALAESREEVERKQLEQAVQDRLARARAAVAEAAARAPGSLDVVRSQVDLLRLEGQLAEARTRVGALSAQASDPDNAYSLGALDLAEGPEGHPAAIERLRVAARSERGLGRARALLVYALAQSDPAAASAELDKLQTMAPTHRALPALRALVGFAVAKAAPPEPPPARKPPPPAPKPPSAAEVQKSTLSRASDAHRRGDLDGAEKLYESVLARSPGNIPALQGLGDIYRQRNATATAAAYYDQILKQDRNHVPTLMARGDMYWQSGNRILAVALYRRVLSQVSSTDPFGQRALRRVEEFDREVAAKEREAEERENAPEPPGEGDELSPTSGQSPSGPGEAERLEPRAPAFEPAPPEPEPGAAGAPGGAGAP